MARPPIGKTGFLVVFLFVSLLATTAGAATFTVDRTDDPDPTAAQTCSAAPDDCSLRGAVVKANANVDDDEIRLPAGHYLLTRPGGFEDDSLLGDLDLKTDITLTGDGASTTVIDGGQILLDRVLHLNPVGAFGNIVVNDVAVTGGKTSYSVLASSPGGGVLVEGIGPVTLNRVDVRGNATNDGGPGFLGGTSPAAMGGGVFVQGTPALVINESRIRGNITGNGVQLPPTPDASDAGDGGGLGVAISGGSVTVQNSQITGNRTGDGGDGGSLGGDGGRGGDGAGVVAYIGTLVLKNVTIADNRTGKGGGGGAGDIATPGGNGGRGGCGHARGDRRDQGRWRRRAHREHLRRRGDRGQFDPGREPGNRTELRGRDEHQRLQPDREQRGLPLDRHDRDRGRRNRHGVGPHRRPLRSRRIGR